MNFTNTCYYISLISSIIISNIVVIIYIIFKKKKTRLVLGKKQKSVDGRIEKKSLQQVSTLEQNGSAIIITDYSTSLYVRVNPTLIKRLRYYTLRIIFRHLVSIQNRRILPGLSPIIISFFFAKETAL